VTVEKSNSISILEIYVINGLIREIKKNRKNALQVNSLLEQYSFVIHYFFSNKPRRGRFYRLAFSQSQREHEKKKVI